MPETVESQPFNAPFASMLDAVKGVLTPQNDQPVPEAKPEQTPVKEAGQDKAVPEASKEVSKTEIQSTRDKKGRFVSLSDADVPSGEKVESAEKPQAAEEKTAKEQPESHNIKQLRQQYELLKAELSNARTELEKAKVAADPAEVDKLRKEKEELSSLWERVSLENRPEFRNKYQVPIKNAIDGALALVPEDAKPAVKWLLEQPDTPEKLDRLEEVLSDVPSARKAKVVAMADRISQLASQRDAEIQNAHQINAEYEKSSQSIRQRQSEELYNDALASASEELPMFQVREGDDSHNKVVLERQARAKHLMMAERDPRKLTEAAFWAVIGQDTLPLLMKSQKEIAALQKELDSIKNSRPMAPKTQGGDRVESDKPKGFVEAMLKHMGQ